MQSIFFISLMNGAAWGGSEEIWYKAALLSAKKGLRVGCAVYYWKGKEKKMSELLAAGCKIHYLPNKGRLKRNLVEKIQYKYTKKIAIRKCIKSLPVNNYDLVVVNQGYFEVTMTVWKNFLNRLGRYALVFHNYSEQEVFKTEKAAILQKWMDRALMNLYDSSRIQEVLETKLGRAFTNSEVIYNPITFEAPTSNVDFPPLENGNYTIVMLAALDTGRKAQDVLISALSSSKWKQRNWTLHLYGEGMDKKSLQDLIIEKGMAGKVYLRGHSENVKTVLQNSHLVLQVTHIDSMPVSVIEAMSMSRPVVVSKIGDMPKWVREGVNGWISPCASCKQIDETLEKAWQQKENWEEMGKNSFKIFKEKFPSSPEEHFLKLISF